MDRIPAWLCRVPVGDIIIHMMRAEIAALNGDLLTVESLQIAQRIATIERAVRDYMTSPYGNQENEK